MFKSWMAIAAITFLVSLGGGMVSSQDTKWFKQLRRPRWLTFEGLIPVIWTVVLICGVISAEFVWQAEQGSFKGWMTMGFYLLLEIAIIAYVPITLRSRNLKLGTAIGLIGWAMGVVLTLEVRQISTSAALLIVPYLIWSPIGSYTTWEIGRLNR
jgi:translocator protein